MMGKASNRKKGARLDGGRDVHALIAAEAAAVRDAERLSFQPAENTPALRDLLDAAMNEVADGVPATITHEGRPYYLRVSFGMVSIKVFDTPTAAEPIAQAITGSSDEFGHVPYH